jgi:hypothetical protein
VSTSPRNGPTSWTWRRCASWFRRRSPSASHWTSDAASARRIRFAAGCRSFLHDIVDIGERIERIRQALDIKALEFRKLDLRQATPEDFPADAGVAYSQRFIHYLRFDEASRLLQSLASRLCAKARLFLSASGLGSELGGGYAHAAASIEHRFAPLAWAMQAKHGVREPVCLYTKEELGRLVVAHGFAAVRTWTTPFGNVKGVFERQSTG